MRASASVNLAISFILVISRSSGLAVDVLSASQFFIICLLEAIKLMLNILESAQQELSLSGLGISIVLGILQSLDEGLLHLVDNIDVVVDVSSNSEEVRVLSSQTSLLRLEVSKGHVGFLNLLAQIIEGSDEVLVGLFRRDLGPSNFFSSSSGVGDFTVNLGLVLFNLGLHLGQLINLFRHLRDGILMLLLEVQENRLIGDAGLFNVLAKLSNFILSLLVEFNLSGSGTTGITDSLIHALQLSSKVRALAFSLGPGLPLGFKLFFKLFYSALVFLDGLLDLGNMRLLIIKLGVGNRDVLLFAGNDALKLAFDGFELTDSLLSHLEFPFNLPPLLLKISTSSLFRAASTFQLSMGRFKLALD